MDILTKGSVSRLKKLIDLLSTKTTEQLFEEKWRLYEEWTKNEGDIECNLLKIKYNVNENWNCNKMFIVPSPYMH